MNDLNEHITDNELRKLLKLHMLERADDPITEQLMDMEALIVFGNEAVVTPPAHKEKELIKKPGGKTSLRSWLRWLLPVVIVIAVIVLIPRNDREASSPSSSSTVTATAAQTTGEKITPGNENNATENITVIPRTRKEQQSPVDSPAANDIHPRMNEMNTGMPLPAGNTKLRRTDSINYDYSNVPVLTPKQIEETIKYKEKMIKQVLKKDKDHWSLVPISKVMIKGDTVSVNAFYISTTEVTNKQYRTFVHDLLIQGRVEDYLKAVPDTLQWTKHLSSAEPMSNMYFWHPAYDNYPVVNVTREGAMMYCTWLTECVLKKQYEDTPPSKRGSAYIVDMRLPVDKEWISAASGGLVNAGYPWEGEYARNKKGLYMANFKPFPKTDTSAADYSADGAFLTAPVSSYWPNKYGLYCMSGNVAEMVWVWSPQMKYTGNWHDLQAGTKGGSWNSTGEQIRIDGEDEYAGITGASPFIGFRPVMTYLAPLKSVEESIEKGEELKIDR